MKIDICKAPPTLWFGEGEERFGLDLCNVTAADRAGLLDAVIAGELSGMQRAVSALVVGWREVCNEQGLPIPFEEMDLDRRVVRNLDRLLGATPLAVQIKVISAVLAFIGVPTSGVDGLTRALGGGGNPVDPTRPPPTPSTCTPPTGPPDGATPRSACAE